MESTADLLLNPQIKHKWIPRLDSDNHSWKILSGIWEMSSPGRIIYRKEPKVKTGENIAIYGSKRWKDVTFNAQFRIVTASVKPPAGGVILYFMFINQRNFYSFHFCPAKQTIELIKRYRGCWSTVGAQSADVKIHQDYSVSINTSAGLHKCSVEGIEDIETKDEDISNGCIGIGIKYCDVEFSNISVKIS